jgi:two-component system, OmpR family, sensor kinase
MSIRLRLSLLYTAILALMMAVFGVVLYALQSQYTLNWLKNDLVVSSDTLAQSVLRIYMDMRPPAVGTGAQTPPGPPPNSSQAYQSDAAFQQQSESEIVRVLDPDGKMVASPVGGSGEALPLSLEGLQRLRNQQSWVETASASGRQLLIYNRPVLYNGQVVSILQVARPLTERNQTLQALGTTLLFTILGAILVAFGLGWLLAGLALQPIQRITQTAQAIGSERDFSRRVSYTGPQDEVGQLAVTFNSMLAQLQEAYQKVAHALDMQRSFVADVSHELRTPLTTLRGNLGLLGRTPPIPAEEQADILGDMVDESDRLIRLVNELLVLARAEAGRALAREPIQVLGIAEEVCRQARLLDPQRAIAVEAAAETTVLADRDALKQVLLILVDNALKHSVGAVTLRARQEQSRVTITVQDAGEGISPEKLAHLFDRFYRGGERQQSPGFGLGLPIARALVEGLGGTITVESQVGQGTTISIHLGTQFQKSGGI